MRLWFESQCVVLFGSGSLRRTHTYQSVPTFGRLHGGSWSYGRPGKALLEGEDLSRPLVIRGAGRARILAGGREGGTEWSESKIGHEGRSGDWSWNDRRQG